ncbi:hypothetical protein TIFTF001_033098 [Ficus carica]|uniref:Putative plant transposon protein domain-containing protein n=1 Tax=Ficus carica TaxID=3494 RepID=A0AA88DXJ6_FICCA|nr:hypothetical protein TIFTF001_033098 [Ficus carica]
MTIKFISSEAATYYNDTVVLKSIVPERGLKPDAFHERQMLDNIEKRKWQTFTAHPQKASVPLVREFYAYAKYSVDHMTVLQGKPISFDRSTINRFYGLDGIDDDEYFEYLNDHLDYGEVLKFIVGSGIEWRLNEGVAVSFMGSALDKHTKAWLYFIGAKLMPVTYFSDVTKDRAVLLYAILSEASIDVGRLIQQSIKQALRVEKNWEPSQRMIISSYLVFTAGIEERDRVQILPDDPDVLHRQPYRQLAGAAI